MPFPYSITISSDVENINDNDTYQLILTFLVIDNGANETYSFEDKNIEIKHHGKRLLDYDIEDAYLVPAVADLVLYDGDEYLKELLFGSGAQALLTIKNFESNIKINGTSKFKGKTLPEEVDYDAAQKVLQYKTQPSTGNINREAVFDDRDTPVPTDPFGYFNYDPVETINSIVNNQDGTVTVSLTGVIFSGNDGDVIKIENVGGITDLNTRNGGIHAISNVSGNSFDVELITDQTYTSGGTAKLWSSNDYKSIVAGVLEDIFQLVNSAISYAGGGIDINHNWIFQDNQVTPNEFDLDEISWLTERLFHRQAASSFVRNCGDVLKYLAQSFCAFTGMVSEDKGFFHKLFYYNSGNTQSIGTVLEREINYRWIPIFYAKMAIPVEPVKFWDSGTFTLVEQQRIVIDDAAVIFWDNGVQTSSNVISPAANAILQAKDTDIDNNFHDSGYLFVNFWTTKRGGIIPVRTDRFVVEGIDYDYLKPFPYDSQKYQIIYMEQDFEANETTIEAIWLGAV